MTEETRNRLFVLDTISGVSFFLGYFIFLDKQKKSTSPLKSERDRNQKTFGLKLIQELNEK